MYLINHSPTLSLGFKITEEVWSGRNVTLDHLRRFGCEALVHVVQEQVSPRAAKGYFLGYPQVVKGYRVWISEDEKYTISRNVVFHEDKMFKDTVEKDLKESKKTKKRKRVPFSFDKTFEDSGLGGVLSDEQNESSNS